MYRTLIQIFFLSLRDHLGGRNHTRLGARDDIDLKKENFSCNNFCIPRIPS